MHISLVCFFLYKFSIIENVVIWIWIDIAYCFNKIVSHSKEIRREQLFYPQLQEIVYTIVFFNYMIFYYYFVNNNKQNFLMNNRKHMHINETKRRKWLKIIACLLINSWEFLYFLYFFFFFRLFLSRKIPTVIQIYFVYICCVGFGITK